MVCPSRALHAEMMGDIVCWHVTLGMISRQADGRWVITIAWTLRWLHKELPHKKENIYKKSER